VRIGVKLGPFYASTGTRRRRRGGSGSPIVWLVGLVIAAYAVMWPLLLGQEKNGGYHLWTWFIGIPWWIFLTLLTIACVATRNDKAKPARGSALQERRHRQ
jgi:hypothetical protein